MVPAWKRNQHYGRMLSEARGISPEGRPRPDEELTQPHPRANTRTRDELHRFPSPETALALGLSVTQKTRAFSKKPGSGLASKTGSAMEHSVLGDQRALPLFPRAPYRNPQQAAPIDRSGAGAPARDACRYRLAEIEFCRDRPVS